MLGMAKQGFSIHFKEKKLCVKLKKSLIETATSQIPSFFTLIVFFSRELADNGEIPLLC